MPAELQPQARSGGLERVMKLRAFRTFAGLAPSQLAVLAELAQERFFPAGALVQEEGTPAREIHYLIEGEVEIRRRGRPPRRFGPLSVINGLAALARVKRSHEVVARVDSTTLSFTHEDQVDVFEDNFEILAGVLRAVAGAFIDASAAAGKPDEPEPPPAAPISPDRDLSLVEKITALRSAAPYDQVPLEALAELARESAQVRHAAGDPLWSAGDESTWSLAIVSGCVAATAGETRFRFGPGRIAGAFDSMAGRAHGFDAVAETAIIGLRIETGMLLDLLEDRTDMALVLLHSMARDVLALRERSAG